MINDRKVRLMTRLAMYEEKEGKDDINLSKYYKRDYVRMQVLNSILYATIGYILVLAMYIGYKLEYLIKVVVRLDYAAMLRNILVIYVIVLAVYVLATWFVSSLYYTYSRKKLARYFRMLRKLRSYYNGTEDLSVQISYEESDTEEEYLDDSEEEEE
ncbi:MAG: hypothetical protein K6B75_08865 [Lachnospiraceae bacterium]|nr:hypothetical protein [Lachnospiraceae bacterium]